MVHYAVLSNHLHLLVEATDRSALARGMQGLSIRMARALNRLAGRRGRVLRPVFAVPVLAARSWLLRIGWRRHGLLDASYVPG